MRRSKTLKIVIEREPDGEGYEVYVRGQRADPYVEQSIVDLLADQIERYLQ